MLIPNSGYYLNEIEENIAVLPFFTTKQAFDNTFVGITDADYLVKIKDKIVLDSGDEQLLLLKSIADSLRKDDNPVLFFYHNLGS